MEGIGDINIIQTVVSLKSLVKLEAPFLFLGRLKSPHLIEKK
jgi:hypothetical protein